MPQLLWLLRHSDSCLGVQELVKHIMNQTKTNSTTFNFSSTNLLIITLFVMFVSLCFPFVGFLYDGIQSKQPFSVLSDIGIRGIQRILAIFLFVLILAGINLGLSTKLPT